MLELYINDSIVDISGDVNITAAYAVLNLESISSRAGLRTVNVGLPKTNRNKTVFENSEIVNNLTTIPYQRLKARALVNGVDTLVRFAELESVGETYNVRLYGAQSDVFALLKDKKLLELDLSEYDHKWTWVNQINSRTNTVGYIYPVIDYHKDSPNAYIDNTDRILRTMYMLPAVYVKTVNEKIFSEIGYSLVNDAETDFPVLEQMILPSYKRPESNLFGKKYQGQFVTSISQTISGQLAQSQLLNHWVHYLYDYDFFGNDINFFTIPELCNYTVDIRLVVSNPFPVPRNLHINVCGEDFNYSIPGSVSGMIIDVTVSKEQQKPGEIFITANDDSGLMPGVLVVNSGSSLKISNVVLFDTVPVNYYDYISISGLLPDLTCAEHLKAYLQTFGLIPIVNEITKTVRLFRFDKILKNISNAYDWSNKLDRINTPELRFIYGEYGRNSKFRYKEDADEQKPGGTDGELIVNNENLPIEKDIVVLPYAATNANVRLNELLINNIGLFEEGEYKSDRQPRWLIVERKNASELEPTDGVEYLDESGIVNPSQSVVLTEDIPFTYFIKTGAVVNLGFGDNVIRNFYQAIQAVIGNAKILTEYVRLSISDINQLDFTRPVYLSQYNAYFYISNIADFSYTNNESTLVELVKITVNG